MKQTKYAKNGNKHIHSPEKDPGDTVKHWMFYFLDQKQTFMHTLESIMKQKDRDTISVCQCYSATPVSVLPWHYAAICETEALCFRLCESVSTITATLYKTLAFFLSNEISTLFWLI